MRRSYLIVFSFLLLVFFAQDAFAYSHLTKARWSLSKMPIPWYATYSKTSDWNQRSKEKVDALVEKSLAVWENIDCSFMMFRYMGTTTTGALKKDGKNVIEWVIALPDGSPSSAVGLGGPIWGGSGIFEGNVWLKAGTRSDEAQGMILTHEIGHAIALGHSDTRNAIMAPAYNRKTFLTQDDKDSICNAYPIANNTCAENDHCPKGLICSGGKCSKCKQKSDCGAGSYCNRGLCEPTCTQNEDCQPKGKICVDNKCASCKLDADCGADAFCDGGLCLDKCKGDDDCKSTETCRTNGLCAERKGCIVHSDCGADAYCENQKCVGTKGFDKLCESAGDCPNGLDCVPYQCNVDFDCKEGYSCKKEGSALGRCEADGKTASVCSLPCGAQKSCPSARQCHPFGPTKNYCYPEKRKPKPPASDGGTSDGDPSDTGCGCSTQPNAPNYHYPFFLAWGLLFFIRRRKSKR